MNETLAKVSATERDIVRLDERIKNSLTLSALRSILLRADAIGSTHVENIYPETYTVMRIEAAAHFLQKEENTNDNIMDMLADEEHHTMKDSLLAYRTKQAIEWVTNLDNNAKIVTPHDMLTLYAKSIGGPHSNKPLPTFRSDCFVGYGTDQVGAVYESPLPSELEELLEDFCSFINKEVLSPLAQASIAQFQFEALRPFDDNLDRVERLLMHYVFNKRRLLENIILPINLFSAHFKNRFYNLLEPNYANFERSEKSTVLYAEDLTINTTNVARDLISFILFLHTTILSLVNTWKKRVGRLQKNSTVELLLYELVGTPIMTIAQGSELVRRSFSATSDAFARLEQVGIVQTGNPIRRNTTFEAPDALRLHSAMEKKRAVTYADFVEQKEPVVAHV